MRWPIDQERRFRQAVQLTTQLHALLRGWEMDSALLFRLLSLLHLTRQGRLQTDITRKDGSRHGRKRGHQVGDLDPVDLE